MSFVFVSYSSKDKVLAAAACTALENSHIRCWIAPRDIQPGSNWSGAIVQALDNCRVFVLVFTSNANDSLQIRREIARAVERGIPIIPLRIENAPPTSSLAYFLGGVQWLDAMTPPLEVHLQRLVQIVKALLLAESATSETDGVQNQSGASVEDRRSIANLNQEVQTLSTKSYHLPWFRSISVAMLTVVAAILIWTSYHLAGIHGSGVDLSRGRASADEATVLSKANAQDTERQADAAFRDKNYSGAKSLYQKTADLGLAAGESNLAEMYRVGYGLNPDYVEAMRWYQKAAAQGETMAQNGIGLLYQNGLGVKQDYAEAMRWFRKAADQGNAWAQANVGSMYRQGQGVTQDFAEALRWYRMAADQGNPQGQNGVGILYQNGQGVGRDYKEALHWYRLAADQGFFWSLINVGYAYANGEGVDRDCATADLWFEKAIATGRSEVNSYLQANPVCGFPR